jgi:hypothetical protein
MGRIRGKEVPLQEERGRKAGGSPKGGESQVLKGLFMEKWLCWGSMGVAGFLLLLFLLDLVLAFTGSVSGPFSGISPTVDIVGIIACGIVIYLAWDAFKDLR